MTTSMDYGLARRMWHLLEPVHAAFWYAPEVFDVAAGLGYDVSARWPSYFAWRAAPEQVFASRGWTPAEWAAARDRLAARGWVDAEGKATDYGRRHRDEIEWRTDRLADRPWQSLGADRAARLAELALPLWTAALESGLLPAQNTLGIAAVPYPTPPSPATNAP